jgi:hypothetical protein
MIMFRVDLNGFDPPKSDLVDKRGVREWLRTVHGEHGDHDIDYDFQFGLICCCTIDEDIGCIQGDFSEIAIDNGWQTQYMTI